MAPSKTQTCKMDCDNPRSVCLLTPEEPTSTRTLTVCADVHRPVDSTENVTPAKDPRKRLMEIDAFRNGLPLNVVYLRRQMITCPEAGCSQVLCSDCWSNTIHATSKHMNLNHGIELYDLHGWCLKCQSHFEGRVSDHQCFKDNPSSALQHVVEKVPFTCHVCMAFLGHSKRDLKNHKTLDHGIITSRQDMEVCGRSDIHAAIDPTQKSMPRSPPGSDLPDFTPMNVIDSQPTPPSSGNVDPAPGTPPSNNVSFDIGFYNYASTPHSPHCG